MRGMLQQFVKGDRLEKEKNRQRKVLEVGCCSKQSWGGESKGAECNFSPEGVLSC